MATNSLKNRSFRFSNQVKPKYFILANSFILHSYLLCYLPTLFPKAIHVFIKNHSILVTRNKHKVNSQMNLLSFSSRNLTFSSGHTLYLPKAIQVPIKIYYTYQNYASIITLNQQSTTIIKTNQHSAGI